MQPRKTCHKAVARPAHVLAAVGPTTAGLAAAGAAAGGPAAGGLAAAWLATAWLAAAWATTALHGIGGRGSVWVCARRWVGWCVSLPAQVSFYTQLRGLCFCASCIP